MKIAVLSNMWPSEENPHYGIFVKKFCDELIRQGISVKAIFSERTGGSPQKILLKYYELFQKVFNESEKFDLIQIEFVFPTGIFLFFKPQWKNLPKVLVFHGTDVKHAQKSKFLKKIYARLIQESTAIIFPSSFARKEIEKNFRLDNKLVRIIPRGIDRSFTERGDREASRKKLKLDSFDVVILSVGNFVEVKNQIQIVKTLDRLETDKKIAVVFAGDGPEKENCEKEAVSKENMTFFFPGRISPDEISALYDASDFFITASLSEGYSVAVQEAMAKGLCVVASSIEAHMEAIEHEKTGFLFNPHSLDELLKILKMLVENPDICKEIGRNARTSSKIWTMERTAKAYVELYREILS
jgi:glycosyltransferase involved in cell wall biosynthesis